MKIVIEFETEEVLQAFRDAASWHNKPKEPINEEAFGKEFAEDLKDYLLCEGLENWFGDGINNDRYLDFYEEEVD